MMFEGDVNMANGNNTRNTKNNRKEDGKFRSKHIKHDRNAESARAVYGLKEPEKKDPE